jgi:thioredoxin 1
MLGANGGAEMGYIMLTDTTFQEEVLRSGKPVLVEFFVEWSGVHHIMAPGLEEIGEKYGTRVKFCRIDTDIHKEMPKRYGIQNIPTILLFKDGQAIDQIAGVTPRGVIAQKLDALLQLEILGTPC